MYSFTSRIRYTELDHQRSSLSCSSLINYFQDCSTFQSEDLNLGISYLNSINRVWLLNGWQLQIYKPVLLGDRVTVSTWPYAFKGFYGYRNFIMANEENEVLAAADSIWIYIDTISKRPVKVAEDNAGYTLEPPYPMSHTDRKIKIPDTMTALPAFPVKRSNIDSYHHVNNGQYVKMAEEYLPEDFTVHSMRVEYRNQAVLGDIITPMVSQEENCVKVVLADPAGKPYAALEFQGRC